MSLKNSRLWQMSEKLIGYDTVSFKSNSAAATMIANELQDLGFKTYIEKFDDCGCSKEQVIAWIGPEVEEGLILSGHIDTVPFEDQRGWTKDALKLTLEDDKVYGRGTCDMKIFITQCLDAFNNLDFSKLKKPLVCIFTSDEEIGCLGAHRLTTKLDKILDTMPMPKRAVIGEPTGFDIINTHKGIVQFSVKVLGIPGHSSRPNMGKNAIELAQQIIKITMEMNNEFESISPNKIQSQFPDHPYNHLHLARINGGEADNMIPNSCSMTFSYRCFPGEDEMLIFNELQKRVLKVIDKKDVQFNFGRHTNALPVSNNSELESILKEVANDSVKSVSFATDAGAFSTIGIESYICGAGDLKQAHMPDEYISLSDFLSGSKYIENLIQSLLVNAK